MKTIELTQGKIALVDDADYKALSAYKWFAVSEGNCFYAVRHVKTNGKWHHLRMHRVLTNCPRDKQVDHKNGDGLDNQRYNLRVCSAAQNMQSFQRKRANTSSRFRGVKWHKQHGRWNPSIKVFGKPKSLGLFDVEETAARAYDAAAIKYFGEYAHLNFPLTKTT